MARFIVGAAGTAINSKTGTSPQILLQIQYVIGLQFFATKSVTVDSVFYDGCIMAVGQVESSIKKDSSAVVSSCSVTLDDTKGFLKNGIDTTIFEKAKANLYLWYEGTGFGDAIPLILGHVSGPVVWDETNRTITFSVETLMENQDYGFAPTDEDIEDLDPEANGVPWPSIFGKAVHVPALKIHKKVIGSLIAPIQLWKSPAYTVSGHYINLPGDPTVYSSVADSNDASQVIYVEGLDKFPAGTTKIVIDGVIFQGTMDGTNKTKFNVTHCNLPLYTNVHFGARPGGDLDVNNDRVGWMPNDTTKIVNCGFYYNIGSGNIFYNYCVQQVGRKCWFREPMLTFGTNSSAAGFYTKLAKVDTAYIMTEVYPIQKNGMVYDIANDLESMRYAFVTRQGGAIAGKTDDGSIQVHLDKMVNDANSWWHSSSDSIVRPITPDSDVFVASLVQLSEVKAVFGKRRMKTVSNKTYEAFQPIPASYYTVDLTSTYAIGSTGQFASTITFPKSLSEYKDQDWEDGIWVTATSTVGPNPVDIVSWIIENFTTYTVDTVGLTAVHDLVRPANFAIFDKRDALQLCEEICWQARMGMILDLGMIQLRFLPKKPILPAVTFTDANIDSGITDEGERNDGMKLTFTPIRNIVTKIVATWTDTYKEKRQSTRLKQSTLNQLEEIVRSLVPDARRTASETKYYIYEDNQDIFGNRPEQHVIYIFNQPSPVKEAVDFWGFRGSNCWRHVQLKGFPDALTLQCYDLVQLAPTDVAILSGGPWNAMVESIVFNFSDMSLTFGLVIPCKAGTTSDLSSDFWPENTF